MHPRSFDMPLQLSSSAFAEGGAIPARYTCDGQNISPPLAWSGAPAATQSFVLIADDPDAPDPQAPRMVWVHWVIYNLPADCDSLPGAVSGLSRGAIAGMTDFQRAAFGGPCPPIARIVIFLSYMRWIRCCPSLGLSARRKSNKPRPAIFWRKRN